MLKEEQAPPGKVALKGNGNEPATIQPGQAPLNTSVPTSEILARLRDPRKDTRTELVKRGYSDELETLERIYDLFGKVTIVPVKIWGPPDANGNFESKGAPLMSGWPRLDYEQTTSLYHQELLCERISGKTNKRGLPGNLAVLLGKKSDDLVAIDLDRRELVEPFFAVNPRLEKTVRLNTFRGQQIFVRLSGDHYPPCVCAINVNGETVGEFRGGNCLSTIFGCHPKGVAYDFAEGTDQLVVCGYNEIVWPKGWHVDDSGRAANKERKSRKPYALAGKPGSVDTESLFDAIGSETEALCAALFPGAKVRGDEIRLSDKSGKVPTQTQGSLTINLGGDWPGWWTDWTTGESGSFIDLVKSAFQTNFLGAVKMIEEALGQIFRVLPTRPILHLPVDGFTERPECNEAFYKGCAATGEYFLRDEQFVYVEEDPAIGIVLRVLDAGELASKIQEVFQLMKKGVDKDKNLISRPVNMEIAEAVPILKDRGNRLRHSLPLRLLSASPVLVDRNGQPEILGKGYHRDEGGIYVMRDLDIPTMSIDEAKELLLDLFADFDFVYPADLSRAIAQVLSPALKLGNLLGDVDFPLDVALGNVSQAGKGHRMKINAAVYGEKAFSINKTQGGVGSLDESISTALLSGKLFVIIDNVRGELDSQKLESILRGTGAVSARIPYQRAVLAQTNRSVWQLTSNEAVVPKDLTNRSIIVSNRKQPDDYKLRHQSTLGWGDIVFANLRNRQGEFLGAVFAVEGEWIRRKRPRTNEKRHNFTEWVQSLDYMVQKILGLEPLMDDHETAAAVLNNPVMGWVREIMKAVETENPLTKENPVLDVTLRANDIGGLCVENNITIPNRKTPFRDGLTGEMERNKHIGVLLSNAYKNLPAKDPVIRIERMEMRRTQIPNAHGKFDNDYTFRHTE